MKLPVVLAVLYDIHGNLPALEAVLAEARDADAYLLGGDYGTPSPWPRETLERLRALPDATWIRGNGERWIFERPEDRPEVGEAYDEFMPGPLSEDELAWLYALPPQAELDGVLYVHGCVVRDDDTFATAQPSPVPAGRAERHAPSQSRQRRHAPRRRCARGVGGAT